MRRSKNPALLLASRSPRRKEIMKWLGIPFKAVPPIGVIEKIREGETPRHLVRRLALEKARSVSKRFPRNMVLGADTVVVSHGRIFGKPASRGDAERMLMKLRNRSHEVWTGVALVGPGGKKTKTTAERTKVTFGQVSNAVIRDYLKTPEPYDKAGAYNIQGSARSWIRKWEGDFLNIVGLPVQPVLILLRDLGA